jgi:DNA-binding transcriptional ArsR family regulator
MSNIDEAPESETPESEAADRRDRDLDLVALKALAHPLRIQIIEALSTYGSFTASGLAERLGESSGATSYHLRQLEKHGFVREVDGKGTTRERWWERVPGGLNIGSDAATATEAGRSASTMIFRQIRYNQERLLIDFVDRATEEMPKEWLDGSVITTMSANMTPAQLKKFTGEYMKLAEKYVVPNEDARTPGSRPIQVNFHAFPVLDGEVVPGEPADKTP